MGVFFTGNIIIFIPIFCVKINSVFCMCMFAFYSLKLKLVFINKL